MSIFGYRARNCRPLGAYDARIFAAAMFHLTKNKSLEFTCAARYEANLTSGWTNFYETSSRYLSFSDREAREHSVVPLVILYKRKIGR